MGHRSSGEGGIRTPGPISETQHFQCCTIGRSVTSPRRVCQPTGCAVARSMPSAGGVDSTVSVTRGINWQQPFRRRPTKPFRAGRLRRTRSTGTAGESSTRTRATGSRRTCCASKDSLPSPCGGWRALRPRASRRLAPAALVHRRAPGPERRESRPEAPRGTRSPQYPRPRPAPPGKPRSSGSRGRTGVPPG